MADPYDPTAGLFGISVAASMVGTGVQNLRAYEKAGLLDPERTAGGTRLYSMDDISRLRQIAALLDPAKEPARVRAMYTHPGFTRRGIGRLILTLCESAAVAEGFTRLELMATLSGRPLYAAAGFEAIEEVADASGGVPVPLIRMGKDIA